VTGLENREAVFYQKTAAESAYLMSSSTKRTGTGPDPRRGGIVAAASLPSLPCFAQKCSSGPSPAPGSALRNAEGTITNCRALGFS
jgi:hypothetical protein